MSSRSITLESLKENLINDLKRESIELNKKADELVDEGLFNRTLANVAGIGKTLKNTWDNRKDLKKGTFKDTVKGAVASGSEARFASMLKQYVSKLQNLTGEMERFVQKNGEDMKANGMTDQVDAINNKITLIRDFLNDNKEFFENPKSGDKSDKKDDAEDKGDENKGKEDADKDDKPKTTSTPAKQPKDDADVEVSSDDDEEADDQASPEASAEEPKKVFPKISGQNVNKPKAESTVKKGITYEALKSVIMRDLMLEAAPQAQPQQANQVQQQPAAPTPTVGGKTAEAISNALVDKLGTLAEQGHQKEVLQVFQSLADGKTWEDAIKPLSKLIDEPEEGAENAEGGEGEQVDEGFFGDLYNKAKDKVTGWRNQAQDKMGDLKADWRAKKAQKDAIKSGKGQFAAANEYAKSYLDRVKQYDDQIGYILGELSMDLKTMGYKDVANDADKALSKFRNEVGKMAGTGAEGKTTRLQRVMHKAGHIAGTMITYSALGAILPSSIFGNVHVARAIKGAATSVIRDAAMNNLNKKSIKRALIGAGIAVASGALMDKISGRGAAPRGNGESPQGQGNGIAGAEGQDLYGVDPNSGIDGDLLQKTAGTIKNGKSIVATGPNNEIFAIGKTPDGQVWTSALENGKFETARMLDGSSYDLSSDLNMNSSALQRLNGLAKLPGFKVNSNGVIKLLNSDEQIELATQLKHNAGGFGSSGNQIVRVPKTIKIADQDAAKEFGLKPGGTLVRYSPDVDDQVNQMKAAGKTTSEFIGGKMVNGKLTPDQQAVKGISDQMRSAAEQVSNAAKKPIQRGIVNLYGGNQMEVTKWSDGSITRRMVGAVQRH